MKKYSPNLLRALKGEHLKKKGTGIYIISIIIGALTPFIYFLVSLFSSDLIAETNPFNYYTKFIYTVIIPFVYFFFPLLIIINASKITQLDHKNGGWQLMETQPLEKFSIYFSKYIVLLIANFLAIFSFFFFSMLLNSILGILIEIPKNASQEIEFYLLLNLFLRFFTASLFLTAFQYFLSVLISSFIWSLLIGFFALMLTSILKTLKLLPDWYPFEIINRIADFKEGSDVGNYFLFTEKFSFIFSIVLVTFGFIWYKNKGFVAAFLKSKRRFAFSILFISIFSIVGYFILRTNQYQPLKNTILVGKIDSKTTFKKAYLIHPTIEDTLTSFDIINNSFNIEIKKQLPLDQYRIVFDNAFPVLVTMASNDSVFIDIQYYNNNVFTKYSGTRLAEHQYSNNRNEWNQITYYLQENINIDKPEKFFEVLYSEWKKEFEKANQFKTRDNFIPKKDFIEREKKLVSIKYLNYKNTYLDSRKAMFPNDKTIIPSEINSIRSKISLDDQSLISDENYLTYLKYEVCKNDNRDIDIKIKEIENISKLKASPFKNRLLFSYLKINLEEASSSKERNDLLNNYSEYITDNQLKNNLLSQFEIFERLGKGNEARLVQAKTLDGKSILLSDFKGKFIAIDVWATWCSPCKYESPFFEKMAIKYNKENIVFVGLSTDKNTEKWFIDAKNKSKSVIHLLLENSALFSKDYNVNSIPRFILIDSEGKIYNANMPRPSQESFEMLLRKALNLKELE